MNQFKTIKVQLVDGVFEVILNRSDKLNALSIEVMTELMEVLVYAKGSNDVRALLITGSGKAFCAGADIGELESLDGESGVVFAKRGQALCRTLEQLGKPSLAAVNGYAFGGGCELAMSASIRIASDKAKFSQPEVKLGVIPGFGGTQRLARLVGKGRALDLCLRARTISSADALAWGLVTEVVPADALLIKAHEVLGEVLASSPYALTQTMQAIDHGFNLALDEALAVEATHFGLSCAHEDKTEGVSAFLNKRVAQFTR